MSLIEYFFTLHNIVNKRNDKKELKREEFIDLDFINFNAINRHCIRKQVLHLWPK